MRIAAILNKDGGTLKTEDLGWFSGFMRTAFEDAGHIIDIQVIPGDALVETLETTENDPIVDAIIAGGGDGTISAAAGAAFRSGKALGVLPAGTMNLFARALGVPLELDQAVRALALASPRAVDIGTMNGRPFVHQYSVGLQAKVVKNRKVYEYSSKLGKICASLKACLSILRRRIAFAAEIICDGESQSGRFSVLAVANNEYGVGHMPYPDELDAGVLGVYQTGILTPLQSARLSSDLLVGKWRENPDLKACTAEKVTIRFARNRRRDHALLDGELVVIEDVVDLELHKGALQVLAPAQRAS
jgi:diacylglycerol kinase family enzyme